MANVVTSVATLPASGGPFVMPHATIGVFLTDQLGHRLATGGSRHANIPHGKHQGWIMPAGAEGHCDFDKALTLVTLSIPDPLLRAACAETTEFEPIVGSLDPVLLSLCLNSQGIASGGPLYRETMHRAMAAQMVQVALPARPEVQDIGDRRLRRVMDYIHDHLADSLSLEDMAKLAAMSAPQFSRAFKAATGKSPLQYVIYERINLAQLLLQKTQLTVAEIAYRVGYGDLSRFGQHFKRQVGVAPANSRK